jgi:RimJ/RimL family protein N-acetyltransferase
VRRRIRLEPFDESHVPAVSELAFDEDVLRFTRVPDPPPPDFGRQWLTLYEEGRRQGTFEGFAIVDADDGTFLGLAVALHIDRDARTAELGYVVAPHARGAGVATEALHQLTEWAFTELDLLRIELLIATENEGSKRVAERCGYVREGVLRSLHLKQGRRQDTEMWSRLVDDPPGSGRLL